MTAMPGELAPDTSVSAGEREFLLSVGHGQGLLAARASDRVAFKTVAGDIEHQLATTRPEFLLTLGDAATSGGAISIDCYSLFGSSLLRLLPTLARTSDGLGVFPDSSPGRFSCQPSDGLRTGWGFPRFESWPGLRSLLGAAAGGRAEGRLRGRIAGTGRKET
jgi:hypothetical protein